MRRTRSTTEGGANTREGARVGPTLARRRERYGEAYTRAFQDDYNSDADLEAARQAELAILAQEEREPVSYTHLTLPTILLV